MRRTKASLIVATLLFLFLLIPTGNSVGTAAGPAFRFAAAGDHSQDINTNSSLHRLASSGVNFYLALGDLSYTHVGEETRWCDIVKSYMGPNFPFEMVSGFHDDGRETSPDDGGLIDYFVNCLPDRLGTTGVYGKEFYFDYPPSSPLARIMVVSPALNFSNGAYYSYDVGSSHYEWLSHTIDAARASGIPWVIVAMHKSCISAGFYPDCASGQDVMNLLIQKKVDLVLQAHDHDYQRSKQLTCAFVEQFSSGCVANDGSSGRYTKGRGTVSVIAGTFGQELYSINYTSPNASYFASLAGSNTPGIGHGFVVYTITSDEISAQTDFWGRFSDSFSIVKPVGTLEGFLLLIKHNLIFVSLFNAPILTGITAIFLRQLRRWTISFRDRKLMRINVMTKSSLTAPPPRRLLGWLFTGPSTDERDR